MEVTGGKKVALLTVGIIMLVLGVMGFVYGLCDEVNCSLQSVVNVLLKVLYFKITTFLFVKLKV